MPVSVRLAAACSHVWLHSPMHCCCRPVLDAARHIAERHSAVLQRAAVHSTSSSSSAYYADPLQLSRLTELPHLFVSVAHRMLGRGGEVRRVGTTAQQC